MISSIEIKNFQSHKHSKLNLDAGVNTIVGITDSGKSAFRRALQWVIYNKPSGDAFRSHWGGDTEVIVNIDDHSVLRRRTNTSNEYWVDGILLKAFGQGVPKEVTDIFNMSDINLQAQFDSFFLISNTSGAVAKYFNKLVDLSIIDKSIANLKSKLRATKTKRNLLKDERKRYKDSLKKYKRLPKIDVLLTQQEDLEKSFKQTEQTISELYQSLSKYKDLSKKIIKAKRYIPLKSKLDKLIKVRAKLAKLENDEFTLGKLLSDYDETTYKLKLNTEYIKLLPTIIQLEKCYQKGTLIRRKSDTLANIVLLYQNIKRGITREQNDIKSNTKIYNENMGDTCILCGQPLKNHKC